DPCPDDSVARGDDGGRGVGEAACCAAAGDRVVTWWGWILFAAYVVGAAVALPRFAFVMANDLAIGRRPGGDDIAFAYFISLMAVAVWPLIWAFHGWYQFARGRNFSGMLVAPRAIRKEQNVGRLQARIAELEREVGIR